MAGNAMIQRFVRDESGMTMGLTVIMVVLIGVMGAGLLTFVSKDLNTVVEVNQGQKALEAADAGIEAAKQQIISDSGAGIHYDGGADDLAWSYCYGVSLCSFSSPTATGSAGMTVNTGSDSAKVTILMTSYSPATYKIISEGQSGQARRKIEAILRIEPELSIPAAYFSRSSIDVGGSTDPNGASFFTLSNFTLSGNANLGTAKDFYFGKWAATTGAAPYPNSTTGSYPNTYNSTARPSALAGVGALGTISGDATKLAKGTRSFDSTTNPKMVADYSADGNPGQQSTEISFPFDIPTPAEDKAEIEALRQRALQLERANPGYNYYVDSNPGNGVDDAGLANGGRILTTWPSGSDYSTVRFIEYAQYNTLNRVSYTAGDPSCATTTNKGAIVIENGDMDWSGNKRFDGGIFIRAYDPVSGDLLTGAAGGLYDATGNVCLYGYVNTSGGMHVQGTVNPGAAPELGSLAAFKGSVEQISWRELYQ